MTTGALVLSAAGAGVSYAADGGTTTGITLGDKTVGAQPNGSYLTATNQFVTPAGEVIKDDGRPFGLTLNPDGKTAASLNVGGASSGIVTVFDLADNKVLQHYGGNSGPTLEDRPGGGIANGGIVYSPDGKYLWAAQATQFARFDVAANGTLSNEVTVPLPGENGNDALPAGLAWAPDGDLLVTFSGSNTLAEIDPATNAVIKQIPVGNDPNSIVVIGGKAYVSDQGGRPAQAGDQTDDSYGTPIVTKGSNEIPASGTVSEVDLSAGKQVKTFTVGLEPSAMIGDGTNLIVANSDDDSVTTIDTASQQVGQTFSVNPAPGAPFGADPDGLAMIDSTHLAVSLGRFNTVAIYTYAPGSPPAFEGLIPTGSYPSGIARDPASGKLIVASEIGLGSVGASETVNEGTGTSAVSGKYGLNMVGTVQQITKPTQAQIQTDTQQVFKNNQWNGLLQRNETSNGKAKPVAVPTKIGAPSTIKHVFLIIKENRTYDQVLGDIGRGNSDPALAQFGKKVTPNTHALATQFPLVDNLYSNGANSGEGHHWITEAFLNNYMEQMYGNYARSYIGEDPLGYVKSGFLWSDAENHGKTVTNWGEQVNDWEDAQGNDENGTWQQWYHDSQVLEGKASGPLNFPLGTYHAVTDVPSLKKVTQPDYPTFDLDIPDHYRADLFQQEFATYEKNGNLPNLSMIWLPDDHTSGTTAGAPTPEAQVADNDLALGRIVDTISHSKYWRNTAIFVEEDDSQDGVDHVDGHRNVALVISPYAKHGGYVDSTYYTQLNIDRTIDQILGIPPMNSQDMAAEPMYNSFTNTPNYTPYNYLPNQVSLTETNPSLTSITNPVQKAWAQWSAKQDYKTEDMVPMAASDRDIWYSNTGWDTPYPGDKKVLLPSQVPGPNLVVSESPGDS
jgi:YVTN family beta-propeller protein